MLRVVVIDDYEPSLRVYSAVIEHKLGGEVVTFSDPREALRHLAAVAPTLLVLDFNMPERDGIEVVRELHRIPGREHTPVIMLTGQDNRELRSRAQQAGVNVFLGKPIGTDDFAGHVRRLADLDAARVRQEDEVRDLRARAETTERRVYTHDREALQALFRAYAARDAQAAARMHLAADIAVLLAVECGCSVQDVQLMRDCAFVYDIGKLAIPEKTLAITTAPSPQSRALIERHADAGAEILALDGSPLFATAAVLAQQHHERYDGLGYPRKLRGDGIALVARVMAVADVLVALTHARADRPAMSFGQALDQIRRERGTHFDPRVVSALDAIKDNIALLRG